jgi:hypothetical protein
VFFIKLISILVMPFLLTACARAEGALAPTGVAADVPATDYSDQVEQSYLPDVDAASLAPVINYVDGLNLSLTGDFEYIKTAAVSNCGCFEDSKPTTHQDPTYKVHDSIFYCVANMPGAVPATSTYALANATIKYGLALANKGWERALADDAALAKGLNVHEGKIYYEAVAKAHNL